MSLVHNYLHGRNITEFSVSTITHEVGLFATLQMADSLPYCSLWRAFQVRRVLKILLHLKHMGFSFHRAAQDRCMLL